MRDRVRYERLTALLTPCRAFADIGCDHGLYTEYMLANGLCERAYACDVSAGSLQKAEKLLHKYVAEGRCATVCADGLDGVDESCDLVFIAGMGGREILSVLQRGFLPRRFVFQPMKNAEALRAYLLEKGATIERDFTFATDVNFYDVLCGAGTGGEQTPPYTPAELTFGRDNIRSRGEDFLAFLDKRIQKQQAVLNGPLSERDRARLEKKIEYWTGVRNGEII